MLVKVTGSTRRPIRVLKNHRGFLGCSSCGSMLGAQLDETVFKNAQRGDYAFEVKSTRFKFGRSSIYLELGKLPCYERQGHRLFCCPLDRNVLSLDSSCYVFRHFFLYTVLLSKFFCELLILFSLLSCCF